MFGLSPIEVAAALLIAFPFVLCVGVLFKKMGFSDLWAIGLALLTLTPLNWLLLLYLVFSKWPIHEELDLLRSQVQEKAISVATPPVAHQQGASPLHVAIRKGYDDVVESLIDHGVDINAMNAEGQTPLQLAIACDRSEIAALLRRHGAES